MRRAFTMVEVLLALSIFIMMSAGVMVVGRGLVIREREEQFLAQVVDGWDQLRQHVRQGDGQGWMTITTQRVRFQEQGALGASDYFIALPDSLSLSPIGVLTASGLKTSKVQYKFFASGAVDSGTIVFRRGNGKYVRLVVMMQWGVMVRKNE